MIDLHSSKHTWQTECRVLWLGREILCSWVDGRWREGQKPEPRLGSPVLRLRLTHPSSCR